MTLYELSRHQFITTHITNQTRGRVVSLIGGLFRLATVLAPLLVAGWQI